MRYATIDKQVGETPLEAAEKLRTRLSIPSDIPLAYAGRLDPMASGKLLILIGDECKRQAAYHALDKTYEVELLFGVHSDSGDVLGIAKTCPQTLLDEEKVRKVCESIRGPITLPYPHFSSKTVKGKPLHLWAIEKRLDEIEIPERTSHIYAIKVRTLGTITKEDLLETVRMKIESIPPVTDPRKRLGADFRRTDVRKAWAEIERTGPHSFFVLSFTCTASSGTYMRSLCEHIGKRLGTCGLALSIHRTTIGKYIPVFKNIGFWIKKY